MNNATLTPTKSTCSGGPDDRLGGVRLGFAAEPVVDLQNLEAAPFYSECLARMARADGVLITASEFIGNLEAQGKISVLDIAILDLVLDALAADRQLYLGCNISPQTLANKAVWSDLIQRIALRPAQASQLTLEITESAPLNDIPDASVRLREARSLGCRLAVDDFGAGFATSSNLRGLHVQWDLIKIDRSCFGNLRKRSSTSDGLRAMVGLAASFAPVVVVEGIETRRHLAAARDAGAHYGQGWMFEGAVPERWMMPDGVGDAELTAELTAVGRKLPPIGDRRAAGFLS